MNCLVRTTPSLAKACDPGRGGGKESAKEYIELTAPSGCKRTSGHFPDDDFNLLQYIFSWLRRWQHRKRNGWKKFAPPPILEKRARWSPEKITESIYVERWLLLLLLRFEYCGTSCEDRG